MKEGRLVVFMKGTPQAPMCGFSRAVVQVLGMHGDLTMASTHMAGVDGSQYKAHDVIANDQLRSGVKEFTFHSASV